MAAINLNQVRHDLGDGIAKQLQELYPGNTIYISNTPTALEFESKEAMYQYIFNSFCSGGATYTEIANLLGLSKDRVAKIVAKQINSK